MLEPEPIPSGLDQLLVSALQLLRRRGYSRRSLMRQKSIWQAFRRFAAKRRIEAFSREIVAQFLRKQGIESPDVPLPEEERCVRRAMTILTDIAERGDIGPRSKWAPPKPRLCDAFEDALLDYEEDPLGGRRYRSSTLQSQRDCLRSFLGWLQLSGVNSVEEISPSHISRYVSSLGRCKPITVRLRIYQLRAFFKQLARRGHAVSQLAGALPTIRNASGRQIPSVWKAEDFRAVLQATDRESAKGKRDYAILLLASRLGIRANDIRALRLEHLRWRDGCLARVQTKTGEALCLPLSEEVRDAIIDYLRNGRPPSPRREVFLQATAPFGPLTGTLWHVIEKPRKRALVKVTHRRGLHSLRHTLASRMLEVGTAMETIAGVLGHRSVESTRIYTRIDIGALRTVALDPEEVLDVIKS